MAIVTAVGAMSITFQFANILNRGWRASAYPGLNDATTTRNVVNVVVQQSGVITRDAIFSFHRRIPAW